MNQSTAILLSPFAVVFVVATVWAWDRVARHWRDDEFWLSYRARLSERLGQEHGERFARTVPSLLLLGVPFIAVLLSAVPDIWILVRGGTVPEMTRAAALVTLALFVLMPPLMALSAVVWRFGAPRRLVPPGLQRRT